jgi:hypothetical protein
VVTDTIGQPITITTGTNTNTNPAIDTIVDPQGTPANITIWQSLVPTATIGVRGGVGGAMHGGMGDGVDGVDSREGSNPRWGLHGAYNFERTPVPFVVPTCTGGDQLDAPISGETLVWQEYYTQPLGVTAGPEGSNLRWGFLGVLLPALSPFTVTVALDGPPDPAISGNGGVWQEYDCAGQTWPILVSNPVIGTPAVITSGLALPPQPDISRDRILWQDISPGTPGTGTPDVPTGGDLDIYGNVATPSTTPGTSSTPTGVPTGTSQFDDVPLGSTFHSFIRCLACRGILSGYADGTFRPGNPKTKGQLSKVVSNAANY